MHRLLIFLAGCAVGYVIGGYVDGLTGDDEIFTGCIRKKTSLKTGKDQEG